MYKTLLTILLSAVSLLGYAHSPETGRNRDSVLSRKEKRDRGLEVKSYTFLPKGIWSFGANLSYTQHNNDNYEFLVVNGIESKGYTLDVSPMVNYAFRDNMTIGVRLAYERSLLDISAADLSIGDDLGITLKDYNKLKHTYTGMITYRYYMGLGRSSRFAFFSEIRAGLGGGQARMVNANGDELEGLFEKTFNLSVGLSPGVVAFITNTAALEVSVGVIGFNYKNIRQTKNQIYEGSRTTSSMNCKINLLSISFGMAFYL